MSDTYTGADLFVDALQRYGVEYVFGNPGTTELPILDALADSDLQYILALQEDIATGMAAGYATRRRQRAIDTGPPLGVVNLHVTPGLAHGLGNVFAAMYGGVPLLVTAGNHERDFRHEEPILTGDLKQLARQFCKYTVEVTDSEALPMLLRRAVRRALTPPMGPVFVALPVDIMRTPTTQSPQRLGAIPTAGTGDPEQVTAATEAFTKATEPVMVLGDHAAREGPEAANAAVKLAEATGARVHSEILGGEIGFPMEHDQWHSAIGVSEADARAAMDGDVVALIGCSTNTTLMRHEQPLIGEGTAIIQISSDPQEVGKNHPADVAIIGDPGAIMQQIADQAASRIDENTRQQRIAAIEQSVETDTTSPAETLTVEEIVAIMQAVAPEAYIVDESITARAPLLERFSFDPGQYLWNTGGGLGYGLPAAVGAALAETQYDESTPVVGFIGDGSYLYYPQTLYTAAAHDIDITVVIPDNRGYRILKDNTVEMLGGGYDDYEFIGMDFEPPVDIATNVESYGARGHCVDTPAAFRQTFATAVKTAGPDVIDALTNTDS